MVDCISTTQSREGQDPQAFLVPYPCGLSATALHSHVLYCTTALHCTVRAGVGLPLNNDDLSNLALQWDFHTPSCDRRTSESPCWNGEMIDNAEAISYTWLDESMQELRADTTVLTVRTVFVQYSRIISVQYLRTVPTDMQAVLR